MRRRTKLCAAALSVSLLAGCALTRMVDHAFLGAATGRPKYENRIYTGLVLLPFAVVMDLVTMPAQLVALAVLGDDSLGPTRRDYLAPERLTPAEVDPALAGLSPELREKAVAELRTRLERGALRPGTALALDTDGQWHELELDEEARAQLLSRAGRLAPRGP